jgi:parallel beta-helix repeat protein
MSTFYVAPTGSDIAVGSTQSPWLTLQHAANTVLPGDTVIVEPGTYLGFRLFSSGTAANPITFESATGNAADVIIHAQPNSNLAIARGISLNAGYVIIDGFSVENAPSDGIIVGQPSDTVRNSVFNHNGWGITNPDQFGGAGILVAGPANDAQLLNNRSYDNREHGIYIGGGADRPVIIGNYLYNNGDSTLGRGSGLQINADGTYWPTVGAVVEQNVVHDNVAMGFSFQGLQDSLIANNVIYGNHNSIAVIFAKGSMDNSFVNNSVISNPTSGSGVSKAIYIGNGGKYHPNTGNEFFNNILVAVGGFPLAYENANPPSASDFNFFWAGTNQPVVADGSLLDRWSLDQWQAKGYDPHSLVGDPFFVAPTLGDFHLLPASLARNAGVALDTNSQPVMSTLGQGWDMGAYGYQTTLTSAPLNMSQDPWANNRSFGVTLDGTLTVSTSYGVVATSESYTGRPLTALLVSGSGPTQGTLTLNSDGSFTYVPVTGFVGTDTFIYEVSDGLLLSNPATVTITVS